MSAVHLRSDEKGVTALSGCGKSTLVARLAVGARLSNNQPPSLEGFMFPDDYRLKPGITALELRDALLQNFNEHVTGELYQQATAQDLTMYEVVTLAAIVQREAAVTVGKWA